LVLPEQALSRLLERIVEARGLAALEATLRETDGAIVATMHNELYITLLGALGLRGVRATTIVDEGSAVLALEDDRGIEEYFPFVDIVDSKVAMAIKQLLEKLTAGRSILLAFDAPPQHEATAENLPSIEFLGQHVWRFDGAAWLAVRAGKPIVFLGTRRVGRRVVFEPSAPLYPDAALTRKEQVAELTARMYCAGEGFIRQHPEAWLAWSYLHDLRAPVKTGETQAGGQCHGEKAYATAAPVAYAR
jgi:lauroyl/myristoyl acyltransferase